MQAAGMQVQLRAPSAPALRAPRATAAGARSPAVAPRANYAPSLRPYTIRKGDTLESIAKKRGLTLKDLTQYNKKLTEKSASRLARRLCCCLVLTRAPAACCEQPRWSRARPSCCPRSSCRTCVPAAWRWRAMPHEPR